MIYLALLSDWHVYVTMSEILTAHSNGKILNEVCVGTCFCPTSRSSNGVVFNIILKIHGSHIFGLTNFPDFSGVYFFHFQYFFQCFLFDEFNTYNTFFYKYTIKIREKIK